MVGVVEQEQCVDLRRRVGTYITPVHVISPLIVASHIPCLCDALALLQCHAALVGPLLRIESRSLPVVPKVLQHSKTRESRGDQEDYGN
jgi:hypothetical protein